MQMKPPTKLDATIASFSGGGVTAGAIAVQWGTYMLSPSWRGGVQDAGLGNPGPGDAIAAAGAK